ncbi:hypothetical protein LX36DRAFT_440180 [Colletotrichum falcatum]|nr:hypothetical protein LX36DRAFT_440180 [Colletotrichum falcatum]
MRRPWRPGPPSFSDNELSGGGGGGVVTCVFLHRVRAPHRRPLPHVAAVRHERPDNVHRSHLHRRVQRRPAGRVGGVGVGAVAQEAQHDGQLPARHGGVQRRVALAVPRVHVQPAVPEEHVDHGVVAGNGRDVERRLEARLGVGVVVVVVVVGGVVAAFRHLAGVGGVNMGRVVAFGRLGRGSVCRPGGQRRRLWLGNHGCQLLRWTTALLFLFDPTGMERLWASLGCCSCARCPISCKALTVRRHGLDLAERASGSRGALLTCHLKSPVEASLHASRGKALSHCVAQSMWLVDDRTSMPLTSRSNLSR